MIAGLDSSFDKPSRQTALAARDSGVRIWCGYLQTKAGVGLAAPWSLADFENARLCGADPIAWCSGWDDPSELRKLAAAWRVKLGLDVEGGIRGDGPWVQGFLDASGAGLYGNAPVFPGRRAAFFVDAGYPGFDPGRTWPAGDPGLPHGWQWEGTHLEFGAGVDRGWYDDWFLQGAADLLFDERAALFAIRDQILAVAARADDVYNGVKYGVTLDKGDGNDRTGQPAGKVAAISLLEQLQGKLGAPAAIDPKALAAELAPLLPHVTAADIDTILKAVSGKLGG